MPDGSSNPKYRRGGKSSGPSGKMLSKFARGKFVAWDGEGLTRADGTADGKHSYVMLVNSEGKHTINLGGLSTRECLRVMCETGEQYKNAIHVAFGASYDVNMILSDCTRQEIERVWAGEWVIVAGSFVVNYRPRKSFSVRMIGRKRKRIVLWDVFGFFQSSFVDALKKYIPQHKDINAIAERKATRSTFDASDVSGILEYCLSECRALVSLMQQLRLYLMDAGLSVQRWDGAGACAAALLKREGVLSHKSKLDATPLEVIQAAQFAYAGGRIETLKYGHAPTLPIHHYDINSAYPHAMRGCPSLAEGHWREYKRNECNRIRTRTTADDTFMLCRIEWAFDTTASAYPFFWRAYDSSIYYPQQGSGYYWWPEVAAALDALARGTLRGRISITRAWKWIGDGSRPFEWITDLFVQRAEWKRAGVGAEKALKLAINSLYGKTAQHVGGNNGSPPRYHQLEWAGYITSSTRAALYRALTDASAVAAIDKAMCTTMRKSRPIVMVSTDGIYSLRPIPTLDVGENLGQWTYEQHDGITVVQSGVYWTYNNGKAKPFCRGFDKGSLNLEAIVDAWRNGSEKYDATLSRFITMGSALASSSDDAFRANWQRWRTAPRTLSLTPNGTKRYDAQGWTRTRSPACGLLDTQASLPAAQAVGQGLESAIYKLPWDADAPAQIMFDDGKLIVSTRIVETEAYDAIL